MEKHMAKDHRDKKKNYDIVKMIEQMNTEKAKNTLKNMESLNVFLCNFEKYIYIFALQPNICRNWKLLVIC